MKAGKLPRRSIDARGLRHQFISLIAGEQGADNDTTTIWCRSTDAGSANVECSRGSNGLRVESVVGLLPAPQSLHGLGWLSVAEHVLALSDLCPSAMVALSAVSDLVCCFAPRPGNLRFRQVAVVFATRRRDGGHHAQGCCFGHDRDCSNLWRLSFPGGPCR